jgi:hypothetical protein
MTAGTPYREGSVERRAFACPSCNALALAETEESAICSRCDIRFSTRETALAIQQTAIRHQGPDPAPRGLRRLVRWRLTPYIVNIVVVSAIAGWCLGVVGAVVCAAIAIGFSPVFVVHDLLRKSR